MASVMQSRFIDNLNHIRHMQILTRLEKEEWFMNFRDGKRCLAREATLRAEELWDREMEARNKDAIPLWAEASKWSHAEQLFLPEGEYWCSQSLYLPPSVGIKGASRGTTKLYFEAVQGRFNENPNSKGFFKTNVTSRAYIKGHGLPNAIVCVGALGNLYSDERHLEDFTLFARGHTNGILLAGRQSDCRIERLHIHGYGSGKTKSGVGIQAWDINVNADDGDRYHDVGPYRMPKTWAQSTNMRIQNNMIEGFSVGMEIYPAIGHISDNQLFECEDIGIFLRWPHGALCYGNQIQRCHGDGIKVWPEEKRHEDGNVTNGNSFFNN